jgi:anti-anti-sigma factor
MSSTGSQDDLTIERHGEVTLVTASPAFENMDFSLIDQAAELMLAPLRSEPVPLVVVDLSHVDYINSPFLSVLLRCWKLATVKGGLMVLAGVSGRARDLLRVTRLDLVWPIYDSRQEAIEALLVD